MAPRHPDKSMGGKCVGRASNSLKREGDALFGTGFRHLVIDGLSSPRTTELRFKVLPPTHPLLRHRRIQLKRPPGNLNRHSAVPLRDRPLQPSLAHKTPGADHIRIDIDLKCRALLTHVLPTFLHPFHLLAKYVSRPTNIMTDVPSCPPCNPRRLGRVQVWCS